MYYYLIERIGDGDQFETYLGDDADKAIERAHSSWDCLTDYDRARRSTAYVGIFEERDPVGDHDVLWALK